LRNLPQDVNAGVETVDDRIHDLAAPSTLSSGGWNRCSAFSGRYLLRILVGIHPCSTLFM